jgi:hypothetical protein
MKRTSLAIVLSATASAVALIGERDARACGGCFHPPTQTVTDITDERMLLSASTSQSTLYDQIRYSGNPTSFAWVLPIHGTVDVGLSADVLFDSIDVITETKIVAPRSTCAPPPNCFFGPASTGGAFAADASAGVPVVTVTKQENVGPYATVQLHSTDPTALETWLAQNGYVVTAEEKPVIAQYLTEGFDFLAMKLLPNQGVQAMRPVRVTTKGGSLSLPLRMASVGTGVSVGITIWVVSDGRYEPQNFPFFHINDSQLVWDWKTSSSNYTTLRAQQEAASGGKGWEIESSLTLNEQLITNVILSGGQYFAGFGPFGGTAAVSDPTLDYLPVGSADAGADAGYQSAEEVRTADIAALFAGIPAPNVRVTRIRSNILHTAMTKDLVLQASADQSEVSNVRNVTQSVNLVCPTYPGCGPVGGTSTTGAIAVDAGAADATVADATAGGTTAGVQTSAGSSTSSTAAGSGATSAGTTGSSAVATSATGAQTATGTAAGGGQSTATTTTGAQTAGNAGNGGNGAQASGTSTTQSAAANTASGGCAASAPPRVGWNEAIGVAAIAGLLASRMRRTRSPRRSSNADLDS